MRLRTYLFGDLMAIEVNGGRNASGILKIQGSKNAVLPLMAASLLTEGTTHIDGCPDITDVRAMWEVIEALGGVITYEEHSITIDGSRVSKVEICQDKVRDIRASVLLMGACLARFGQVTIAYPGGCSIGKRPIDFHLLAFRAMGVTIEEEEERLVCRCAGRLKGCDISLPFPSVGATENAILAASMAEGETTICNAAREPEIVELVCFLRQMGAKIEGEGTTCIHIEGVSGLQGISWKLSEDRIAFLTYAMMVAGCGGEVSFQISSRYLNKELWILEKLGCQCSILKDWVKVKQSGGVRPIHYIRTGPYPEYPTDGQSLLLAVLSKAHGVSNVEEMVFENRFRVISQLQQMGANIDYVSNRAQVIGVTRLHGARVSATDLRSGAALLIAAAMAEGVSHIQKECYINRGYEAIVENMNRIGFNVRNED